MGAQQQFKLGTRRNNCKTLLKKPNAIRNANQGISLESEQGEDEKDPLRESIRTENSYSSSSSARNVVMRTAWCDDVRLLFILLAESEDGKGGGD